MVPLAMESPMQRPTSSFSSSSSPNSRLISCPSIPPPRDERRMILAPIQFFISSPSLEADDDDALPIARRIFPERVVKILPSFLSILLLFVPKQSPLPPIESSGFRPSVGPSIFEDTQTQSHRQRSACARAVGEKFSP